MFDKLFEILKLPLRKGKSVSEKVLFPAFKPGEFKIIKMYPCIPLEVIRDAGIDKSQMEKIGFSQDCYTKSFYFTGFKINVR